MWEIVEKRESNMLKKRIALVVLGVMLALGTAGLNPNIYGGPAYAVAAEVMGMGVVTGDSVNVRSEASKDGSKLGSMSKGDKVTVIGEEDGWYKIQFDGKEGYVSADYVDFEKSEAASVDEEKEAEGKEEIETPEEEDDETESGLSLDGNLQTVLIIAGVVVVLLIIIMMTIRSIKRLDEDDEDDYYEEDEYDDEYEEDEYEDDEEEYEDEEDDEYEEEYYEEPPKKRSAPVKQAPKTQSAPKPQNAPKPQSVPEDPVRYMSNNPDDYRIDIDPKFFETTTLPKIDDVDAPTPLGNSGAAGQTQKEADLAEAMKKMEELRQEIERIKQES